MAVRFSSVCKGRVSFKVSWVVVTLKLTSPHYIKGERMKQRIQGGIKNKNYNEKNQCSFAIQYTNTNNPRDFEISFITLFTTIYFTFMFE